MIDHATFIKSLGLVVIVTPALLVAVLGCAALLGRCLGEVLTSRLCQAGIVVGLLAAFTILVSMLACDTRYESIELGRWVALPHYHLALKLVFDRLSVPLVILTFVLCGTIAGFAGRYLHRESGYYRFFFLYSLFVLGMILTTLAGTIETLFTGWELVGLSSVLLVAYFQERPAPVRNGLWVWTVYRISDAALLLAAIVLHHQRGEGDFSRLLVGGPWPEGVALVTGAPGVAAGLLLIVAAAGKSALVPFSGWLPRAMEGPTPSSAIFYGALSVHLGAFLLLRVGPLIETSALLMAVILALGLATAVYAWLAGSVQSDIKTALCYASLVQVGLVTAEIGLGFRYLPLVHLLGNASLRTLQFVRAPTLLHDYHQLESALGEHLPQGRGAVSAPERVRAWLYRFALERGYLDAWLSDYVVQKFVRLFRSCDALERRWTDFVAGRPSRKSETLQANVGLMEDLP